MMNWKIYFLGAWLGLCAVALDACRNDAPPRLSLVCTLDGVGGGDCADPDGKYVYKAPSEMLNYWATTQTDEANYTAWCYGTAPALITAKLEETRARIKEAKARHFSEIQGGQ